MFPVAGVAFKTGGVSHEYCVREISHERLTGKHQDIGDFRAPTPTAARRRHEFPSQREARHIGRVRTVLTLRA